MNKKRNIILSVLFITILCFLLVNQACQFVPDLDYNENKTKADLPKIDINKLDYFPKEFDTFYYDNFNFRGYFIKVLGWLNIKMFDKPANPDRVYIGKDKWLFCTERDFPHFNGSVLLSDNDIKIMVNELKYRKSELDKRNIKMLIVIVPTKYSIYPEYFIDNYKPSCKTNLTHNFISNIEKHTDIDIINLTETLLANKNKGILYYKGDTHWNFLAGYYASEAIINHIDSNIYYYKLSDYKCDTIYNFKGDLTDMTGYPEFFAENDYIYQLKDMKTEEFSRFTHDRDGVNEKFSEYQISYRSNNTDLPDALIIRDSFGKGLMPFLSNSFYHSTYIFDEWNYKFNLHIIEKEKPDIVIYEIFESMLPYFCQTIK